MVLTASVASAVTTTYNNVTAFNAALPGGTSTLEDFDAEAPGLFTPNVERIFSGFGVKYENSVGGNQRAGIYTSAQVNQNSGTALNGTNSLAWGEFFGGSFINGGDGPNVTFRFFQPITAFAFEFSDSDTTDSYSVKIGNESPFAITGSGSTFTTFVGFVSDTAFSEIVFSQTATGGATETFSVDNIRTNGVAAPVSAVPLPAGAPLMFAGLAAFGWVRSRKSKA